MIGDATSKIIKIAIYLKYYLKTELIDFEYFHYKLFKNMNSDKLIRNVYLAFIVFLA